VTAMMLPWRSFRTLPFAGPFTVPFTWPFAGLLTLSACGYSLDYRLPPGVSTIAVPLFVNDTFPLRREIEFELTALFRQELQSRARVRIVDSAANPDLVVRGRIREFREWVVAETRTDQKSESSVVANVELEIENYTNDTVRAERVYASEPFSIQSGETFQDAQRRALRNVAEKLVIALEDWGDESPEAAPMP